MLKQLHFCLTLLFYFFTIYILYDQTNMAAEIFVAWIVLAGIKLWDDN